MDVVINTKPGGFSLSRRAMLRLAELDHRQAREDLAEVEKDRRDPDYWRSRHDPEDDSYGDGIERNDPLLLQVVRDLGPEADGPHASLKIVAIPDGIRWTVEENDAGEEWVAEEHRIWY